MKVTMYYVNAFVNETSHDVHVRVKCLIHCISLYCFLCVRQGPS